MVQCEWAKILVGLQLCWPSFVYDYSEDENSLSLHQSLSVNRPYLQSALTIANSAFTFAMAQCELAKILVGLQLCWPSFVYEYSEDENSLSLHQSLGVNRPNFQSVLRITN